MARSTANVWATDVRIGPNSVRQLLVRAHDDVQVHESADGRLSVRSRYGIWPARRGSRAGPGEPLTATLPVLGPGSGPISWGGSREQICAGQGTGIFRWGYRLHCS